jgi:hypothetical protein
MKSIKNNEKKKKKKTLPIEAHRERNPGESALRLLLGEMRYF